MKYAKILLKHLNI